MNWLRKQREKLGMSQLKLSCLAGVDKNTIWNIETGRTKPRLRTLRKLANAGVRIPTTIAQDILPTVAIKKMRRDDDPPLCAQSMKEGTICAHAKHCATRCTRRSVTLPNIVTLSVFEFDAMAQTTRAMRLTPAINITSPSFINILRKLS